MIQDKSYPYAFFAALLLHVSLLFLLLHQATQVRPVLEQTTRQDNVHHEQEQAVVLAVSVDAKQVQDTIKRLKTKRRQEQEAHERLQNQAKQARQQRIEEQKRIQALKDESLARKKRLDEQKQHLENLKQQQEAERKALAKTKKRQQEESEKLAAALEKKEEERKRKEEEARLAEIAKAEAEKEARIAGEVDKYKALIINAISQRWILPEAVDQTLSSQFKIRLAPDGTVLEATLMRSSGDTILDRSAQSAIYKASPLPVPGDADAFNVFREISLTVRPENAKG